ncbi:MAG: SPASM domain-containing protein [Bacteroidales bacterium]|nr:SPASM domain-containing protein [Bacteroidales bacterium]
MPVVKHIKYPVDDAGKPRKGARPFIVDPATEAAQLSPWSVSSLGFGKFMCDIFDEWVRGDVGRYYVGLFDATLANWCGVQPGTCVYCRTCGGNAIIEHNGDFYPCDHFVYPKYRLGNITEQSIRSMAESPAQVRFGIDKRNTLPNKCFRCKWLFACNGECPKHRFNKTENGDTGLNALCEGYCKFFDHTAPYMEKMKELLENEQPPALIIPWARMRRP